jgi:hypothetical protein
VGAGGSTGLGGSRAGLQVHPAAHTEIRVVGEGDGDALEVVVGNQDVSIEDGNGVVVSTCSHEVVASVDRVRLLADPAPRRAIAPEDRGEWHVVAHTFECGGSVVGRCVVDDRPVEHRHGLASQRCGESLDGPAVVVARCDREDSRSVHRSCGRFHRSDVIE